MSAYSCRAHDVAPPHCHPQVKHRAATASPQRPQTKYVVPQTGSASSPMGGTTLKQASTDALRVKSALSWKGPSSRKRLKIPELRLSELRPFWPFPGSLHPLASLKLVDFRNQRSFSEPFAVGCSRPDKCRCQTSQSLAAQAMFRAYLALYRRMCQHHVGRQSLLSAARSIAYGWRPGLSGKTRPVSKNAGKKRFGLVKLDPVKQVPSFA